jgi:hypothetical protein
LPYAPFDEKFPAVARKETRSFQPISDHLLGTDEFGLLEMYCDEPGCDCRRVMFSVVSRQQQKVVAYIAYGWESAQFYMDWFGSHDPDTIREMQGPALNTMSPQSNIAPALLPHIEGILQDVDYIDRLKRHYAMFRELVDKETAVQPSSRRQRLKKPKRKKRR